ncbi:MAG: hypothetical protein RQ760_21500 [Sedimentisphaerales bacterium]|nr:hypothetical protein [Sedimentisphaerales bacterium]
MNRFLHYVRFAHSGRNDKRIRATTWDCPYGGTTDYIATAWAKAHPTPRQRVKEISNIKQGM